MRKKKKPEDLKPGEVAYIERGLFARGTKGEGLKYGISYKVGRQRFRKITGPKKSVARKELAKVQALTAKGRYELLPRKKAPLVSEACRDYLKHVEQHKRCSWKRDKGVLARFEKEFGAERVDRVTPAEVSGFHQQSASRSSQAAANRELAIIKRFFEVAMTVWEVIDKNPARKVPLFKEHERDFQTLTSEQAEALVEACSDELRPIVLMALNTGMRRGEILDLRWENVDLERRVIKVTKSKSGKIRKIPINETLLETLRLRALKGPSGYVFHNGGQRITTVQKSFDNAARRAGIQKIVPRPESGRLQRWPTLHTCRHTFATNLVLARVDIVTVKELLGHASIKTTMRYSHPTPESKRNAVDLLSNKNVGGTFVALPPSSPSDDKTSRISNSVDEA